MSFLWEFPRVYFGAIAHLIQYRDFVFKQHICFDFPVQVASLQHDIRLARQCIACDRLQLQVQIVAIQMIQQGLDAHVQARNSEYRAIDVTDIRLELLREMFDAPIIGKNT